MNERLLLGGAVLLRMAGLPMRDWCRAGAPDLFDLARGYERDLMEYRQRADALASWLGSDIVPSASLSRSARGNALALRRRLHAGSRVTADDVHALGSFAWGVAPSLIDEVGALAQRSSTLADTERELEERATRAELRIVEGAAALADDPLRGIVIRSRDAHVAAQLTLERRPKRRRHYAEFVWEVIDRAATKTTPRGWYTHVALPTIDPRERPALLRVRPIAACIQQENLHRVRGRLMAQKHVRADARLAVTPLRWREDAEWHFLIVDVADPSQVCEVSLRATPYLEAVVKTLTAGPRASDGLAVLSATLGAPLDVVRGFVEHLVQLGVVQATARAAPRVIGWRALHQDEIGQPTTRLTELTPAAEQQNDVFLDVYRQTESDGRRSAPGDLEGAITQAQRLLTAIRLDQSGPLTNAAASSLVGLMRAIARSEAMQRTPPMPTTHWPTPARADSAYARLLTCIDSSIDGLAPSEMIRLDAAMFDAVGVPKSPIDWPVDCVLRLASPSAPYAAVLDEMFPAGALDARFVQGFSDLGADPASAAAYAAFLAELEQQSGVAFIEILVPPLSLGAANAVRRPLYTRLWTGDPDVRSYADTAAVRGRYVPLTDIEIRLFGDRQLAIVGEQVVCPTYHATRLPLPPWDRIVGTLMALSPLPLTWSPRRLHRTLDALPHRSFVPRIGLGDETLVVSVAQWRLGGDQLDGLTGDLVSRVRALTRLCERLRIPRFAFVTPDAGGEPQACDLESPRAFKILERVRRLARAGIVIAEMLPGPDDLFVRDAAYMPPAPVASSLVLRLPMRTPTELAARLAPNLSKLQALTASPTRRDPTAEVAVAPAG